MRIPFIYFFCLIILTRTSSIMLNRKGMSRNPFLVPDLSWESFYSLTIKYDLIWVFFLHALLGWGNFSSLSNLLSCFVLFCYERVLDFFICFFCIYWDGHVFSLLYSYSVLHWSVFKCSTNHVFLWQIPLGYHLLSIYMLLLYLWWLLHLYPWEIVACSFLVISLFCFGIRV